MAGSVLRYGQGIAAIKNSDVFYLYTPIAARNATLYKGPQAFFETGSKAGIQPHHAQRLARQLARLDLAKTASDMSVPGWKLHLLAGVLAGHHSVTVNGNWRITLKFEGEDAVLVDYQDYH